MSDQIKDMIDEIPEGMELRISKEKGKSGGLVALSVKSIGRHHDVVATQTVKVYESELIQEPDALPGLIAILKQRAGIGEK